MSPLRMPKMPWQRAKRPPLVEQAPAQGLTNALGKLSLYAAPLDPPPGGDASYRKMQHDPQVKACLNTKKFAVLSRGWDIHPASDSPEDKRVSDFCRWCINAMEGSILDAGYDVMDALAFGVSLVEINYRLLHDGPWAGMVGLQSLKAKDMRHFTIRTDEFYNIEALRIATGDELDPSKFLVYTYQPRYGNPYGESDLRSSYRAWYIKEAMVTWWAKFLEKHGMPTVLGEYDSKAGFTKQQQADFLSVVAQVHNESALVIPDNLKLSLMESKGGAQGSGASGGSFDEMINFLDRSIAKGILGETLTSESASKGATYALGAVHMDVLRFYINKLTRDVEETVLTYQLLARLVGYNFPAGTAVPFFRFGSIDDDRLATLGTLITQLITGQVIGPDEPWIRGYLDLPAADAEAS